VEEMVGGGIYIVPETSLQHQIIDRLTLHFLAFWGMSP